MRRLTIMAIRRVATAHAVLVLSIVATVVVTRPLPAQSSAVLLQLRPRVGDTLRLRLDQTVEMAGTVRAPTGESTSTESSTLVLLSRLVVESTDTAGASVLAIADSVRLSSPPGSATGSLMAWAKVIEGRHFRFRVATDGSTSMAGVGAAGTAQVGSLIAQMPATLPRRAITPGTTWTRSMEIPLATASNPQGTATLTATFEFDSLSRNGELAFLSLRGRLTRASAEPTKRGAGVVESSGTISGHVLVDRRRGWITDARTTLSVRSLVIHADGKPPMRIRMVVSQWMRAM
jgi:hypothetical protein